MSGKIVNSGIDSENTDIIGDTSGWVVHLYKNNHTPAVGDTTAAYTEANYDGYAAVPTVAWALTPSAGGTGSIVSPGCTFVDTGAVTPNNIYGYYVTDSLGVLVMAELFVGGPYVFNALGVGIILTITQSMIAS